VKPNCDALPDSLVQPFLTERAYQQMGLVEMCRWK
jgi:hypothetical protein